MTKKELKELLEPLIKQLVKESVREILLEGGILSKIISEVAIGLSDVIPKTVVGEYKEKQNFSSVLREESVRSKTLRDERMREHLEEQKQQRKKLLDSIGYGEKDGLNPFSGTIPLQESGKVSNGASSEVPSPLSGIPPNDPGIDISKILGNVRFNVGNKKAKLGE